MNAPDYELIDRYLWINAAASSIELTENEFLSITEVADNQLYEPLLKLDSLADKEAADRAAERILSRIDNPHLSANFDTYLREYVQLKQNSVKNKAVETMTYYIHEFYRIAEIYFNSAFSTPVPHLQEMYQDYIQSVLKNVSFQNQAADHCPRLADPYQKLPWHKRFLAKIFPNPQLSELQKLSEVCRKTYESIQPIWCKLTVYKNKAAASEFNPWTYISELSELPYEQAAAKAHTDFEAAEQYKKTLEMNFAAAGQKLKMAILNRIKVETVSSLLHASIIRHFDREETKSAAPNLSESGATA